MPNEAQHTNFLETLASGDMDAAELAYNEAIGGAAVIDALSDKGSPFTTNVRLNTLETP